MNTDERKKNEYNCTFGMIRESKYIPEQLKHE